MFDIVCPDAPSIPTVAFNQALIARVLFFFWGGGRWEMVSHLYEK